MSRGIISGAIKLSGEQKKQIAGEVIKMSDKWSVTIIGLEMIDGGISAKQNYNI